MKLVSDALGDASYEVVRASDALEGLKDLHEFQPDMIIMGSQLPNIHGEDALLRIRQAISLPIMVLGNKDECFESLETGADAFMTRPPGLRELVARVRNLLRRANRFGPYKNDYNRGNMLDNNNDPPPNSEHGRDFLTPTEFRLASCLMANKGKLVSYSRLLSEVWGRKEVSIGTLHFHVRRLRRKMEAVSSKPVDIVNSRGVGYIYGEVT